MNCLVYAACFLAALQSALAIPTALAPRADQNAGSHKGQSNEKCLIVSCFGTFGNSFNGPWGFGSSYLAYPYLNNNYNYLGGLGVNLGLGFNSFGAGSYGLFKKDASETGKHQDHSV